MKESVLQMAVIGRLLRNKNGEIFFIIGVPEGNAAISLLALSLRDNQERVAIYLSVIPTFSSVIPSEEGIYF